MPLVNVLINSTTAGGGGTRGFTRGNAPPAPNLDIQYLVVGGGDAVYLTGYGGGGGGFLSGSASMSFNDTLTIEVGAGGTAVQDDYGKESYISSSLFGMLIASGAIEGQSGLPQGKSAGLGGPPPNGAGGGAGAGQNGGNGNLTAAGLGGNGLQWLNGTFYAGGGGGSNLGFAGVSNGYGGDGGGGTGAGTPYTQSLAVNGLGGGAGGSNGDGGSGIVIIRYSTGSVNPPYDNAISGGTRTVNGGYVYHTFTGSGELSYKF